MKHFQIDDLLRYVTEVSQTWTKLLINYTT